MDFKKIGLYTRMHPSVKKYIEREEKYLSSLNFFGNGITIDTSDEEIESIYKKRLEAANDENIPMINKNYRDINNFRKKYPNPSIKYKAAEEFLTSVDSFIEPSNFVKDERFSPTFELLYCRILYLVNLYYSDLFEEGNNDHNDEYFNDLQNVFWKKIEEELKLFLKKLKIDDISIENIRSKNISWLFEELMARYSKEKLDIETIKMYFAYKPEYEETITILKNKLNELISFFSISKEAKSDEIDSAYQKKKNKATSDEEKEVINKNYEALKAYCSYFNKRQTQIEGFENEIKDLVRYDSCKEIITMLFYNFKFSVPIYNYYSNELLIQIGMEVVMTKTIISTEIQKYLRGLLSDDEKDETLLLTIRSIQDFINYFENKRDIFMKNLKDLLDKKLESIKKDTDINIQKIILNYVNDLFENFFSQKAAIEIKINKNHYVDEIIRCIKNFIKKYQKITEKYNELSSKIKNIDIPDLKSRFIVIEQKWNKLTLDDLEQVGKEIDELLKEVKRWEIVSPANTDNLDYEIYVRKFGSQSTYGAKSNFFVLDRQQMIMYIPNIYRTETYPISEEDLNQNFISLPELLVNCKVLNESVCIPEIDYGLPKRIIHYWDNKYAIYADSLGYNIMVGPLGEMKRQNISWYDEKVEWQKDCTIGGCIEAIRKQCLQKLRIIDTKNSRK